MSNIVIVIQILSMFQSFHIIFIYFHLSFIHFVQRITLIRLHSSELTLRVSTIKTLAVKAYPQVLASWLIDEVFEERMSEQFAGEFKKYEALQTLALCHVYLEILQRWLIVQIQESPLWQSAFPLQTMPQMPWACSNLCRSDGPEQI